jgi:hypothetical protein
MKTWLGLLLVLSLALGDAGCRNGGSTTAGCPSAEPSGTPVDTTIMAFLSAARALHHEADLREKSGDAPGAIAALERLVAMPAPAAAEVDEVLADTRARLAELRLARGDLDGADRDVRDGLQRVAGPTYFRGHLLEVQGLIEEARATAFVDAVKVQEQVIDRALADGGRND